MEEKPGGNKAWMVLENMEKKPGVSFCSVHIKNNDEVELKHIPYLLQ